jgi:hypothetical protein
MAQCETGGNALKQALNNPDFTCFLVKFGKLLAGWFRQLICMKVSDIRQMAGHWQAVVGDNLMVALLLAFALLITVLIFGGLLLEFIIQKRRDRAKAKAVERLHKHLESLPGAKS